MRKPFPYSKRKRSKGYVVNPFLKGIVRSFRTTMFSVFVFSFFLNLLALTVPVYLLQIYDKVLPSRNFDTLTFLTGIVLVAVLALGALESVRRTLLRKMGIRFDEKVSEHLLSSSIHRALKKSSTSVGVMRDLSSIRNFLSGSSMFPLLDIPWTPLFIFILYLLHPLLGLVGVVGCLSLFCLALINEYATREGVRENSTESKELHEKARTYVRNADVVQAMGMQSHLLDEWQSRNNSALEANFKVGRINTRLQTISKMLRLFLLVVIIFVAAWLILRGELTAGATIASVLLLRRAVSPLEQSIRSWKSVIKARSSFRNISEYLDHSSSLESVSAMPAPSGNLVAENLGYRRSGEDRSVFSRVDLSLEPGTIAVLSGETAAGKSTLIRVLAGVTEPTSGKVMLDGYERSQWTSEQIGPYIGYLPQHTGLFPGTVRYNIARLQAQPVEKVIEAAKLARAHEMIQQLPQGYDTEIDEDGTNLSGGQRQKIGLARALFGDPKIVLLDEPDANLDSTGRSALRKTLRQLRENDVAILVVSHHSGIRKLADLRFKLSDRRVLLDVPRLTDERVNRSGGKLDGERINRPQSENPEVIVSQSGNPEKVTAESPLGLIVNAADLQTPVNLDNVLPHPVVSAAKVPSAMSADGTVTSNSANRIPISKGERLRLTNKLKRVPPKPRRHEND